MIKAISYGGGVQSTALVLLAIEGTIDFDVALFANVGDDSEHPASLAWVRDVMQPYAESHGFPVHELHRVMRDGTTRTLMEDLERDSRTINIPIRMANGAPGNRNCTHAFKVQVVGKWLKAHGASKDDPATVAIGISTDEFHRASNKRAMPYENPVYPLIEMGWDRSRCMAYIKDVLGAVPPKSSCFFCPFHRPAMWSQMKRYEPELFEKSVALEKLLNERRAKLGKDPVWLTRFNMPLDEAIAEEQDSLPGMAPDIETCDEGYCWT